MDSTLDWQTSCHEIRLRGEYLLKTGKWADCRFLVGSDNNQQMVHGHKLILAMSSPVFDAMFNGTLPEKNDPIPILDVQPDAFVALLEYIYTDKININSIDKACELCYVAKKYMLPFVVQKCTEFLWSDLSAKNVCRAFEFAKLFEEPELAERCLQIICTQTNDVLMHPSFEDIELSTLMTILEQEFLHIDSELDLFLALARYAEKHNHGKMISKEEEEAEIDVDAGEGPSNQQNVPLMRNETRSPTFRDAVKKIRFLTLNPKQFADNVPRTNLLSTSEAFAVLMNISSADTNPMPEGFSSSKKSRFVNPNNNPTNAASMSVSYFNENAVDNNAFMSDNSPFVGGGGGSSSGNGSGAGGSNNYDSGNFHVRARRPHRYRDHQTPPSSRDVIMDVTDSRRFYCVRTIRQQIDYFNSSVSDCALTFTVDRNISITGIQVSTQVLGEQNMQSGNLPERYSELLYAHLLDSFGTRLTYTHCTSNVRFDSLLEISFDHPVQIQRNRFYKIGVAFNKVGWYPMCTCVPTITCEGVCFDFRLDGTNGESVRDGLIRSIVFTYSPRNERDAY